jgi:hypothetical protein
VAAPWGIDRVRTGVIDGEVTRLEEVGAALPQLGVHDGHGDGKGGVEC